MDKKLKAFPEVERVFGKLGRADTSTDPAPVEMIETTVCCKPQVAVAAGHDQGQARRRDGQGDADRRLRQQLDAADPHARHDAGHRHPDAGRHQGERARISPSSRRSRSRSRRCCSDFPGTQSVIAERISQGYFVDAQTRSRADGRSTASPSTKRCRRCDSPSAATTSSASGRPTRPSCRWRFSTRPSTSTRWTRCGIRRSSPPMAGRLPLGDIADVAVREAPEMIRNDNGELAGYIYVYLDDITGPDYVEQRAAASRART